MRAFFLAICLGVGVTATPAHSVDPVDVLTPSPVSIAISVGKWLIEDRQKLYYLRVSSSGSTETAARQSAFEFAIDHAVGSLIVTETRVDQGAVLVNKSVEYSSAYVERFEYVSRTETENSVNLVVDVWVRESTIRDRIGLPESASADLDGASVAESFAGIARMQASTADLIDMPVADFPELAWTTSLRSHRAEYRSGLPVVVVEFDVSWRSEYLESLEETFKHVGTRTRSTTRESEIVFAREHCVLCRESRYIINTRSKDQLLRGFALSRPQLKVVLEDTAGRPVYQDCVNYTSFTGTQPVSLYTVENTDLIIHSNRKLNASLIVHTADIPVERVTRIDLSVVKGKDC